MPSRSGIGSGPATDDQNEGELVAFHSNAEGNIGNPLMTDQLRHAHSKEEGSASASVLESRGESSSAPPGSSAENSEEDDDDDDRSQDDVGNRKKRKGNPRRRRKLGRHPSSSSTAGTTAVDPAAKATSTSSDDQVDSTVVDWTTVGTILHCERMTAEGKSSRAKIGIAKLFLRFDDERAENEFLRYYFRSRYQFWPVLVAVTFQTLAAPFRVRDDIEEASIAMLACLWLFGLCATIPLWRLRHDTPLFDGAVAPMTTLQRTTLYRLFELFLFLQKVFIVLLGAVQNAALVSSCTAASTASTSFLYDQAELEGVYCRPFQVSVCLTIYQGMVALILPVRGRFLFTAIIIATTAGVGLQLALTSGFNRQLVTGDQVTSALLSVVVFVVYNYLIGAVFIFFAMQRELRQRDVFKQLTVVAQECLASLREQKVFSALLSGMLPATVLERYLTNTLCTDIVQSGSVLYSDVVMFTQWSSTRTAHEVVRMLSVLVRGFDELALAYTVEKVKTIGDGYWAFTGMPIPCDDHAVKLCYFAVSCQAFVATANTEHPEWGGNLQIRVGIHSGPLIGGVVGAQQFSYEVFGDTNQVAKHAEEMALPGQILVTESTLALVHHEFAHCEGNAVEYDDDGADDEGECASGFGEKDGSYSHTDTASLAAMSSTSTILAPELTTATGAPTLARQVAASPKSRTMKTTMEKIRRKEFQDGNRSKRKKLQGFHIFSYLRGFPDLGDNEITEGQAATAADFVPQPPPETIFPSDNRAPASSQQLRVSLRTDASSSRDEAVAEISHESFVSAESSSFVPSPVPLPHVLKDTANSSGTSIGLTCYGSLEIVQQHTGRATRGSQLSNRSTDRQGEKILLTELEPESPLLAVPPGILRMPSYTHSYNNNSITSWSGLGMDDAVAPSPKGGEGAGGGVPSTGFHPRHSNNNGHPNVLRQEAHLPLEGVRMTALTMTDSPSSGPAPSPISSIHPHYSHDHHGSSPRGWQSNREAPNADAAKRWRRKTVHLVMEDPPGSPVVPIDGMEMSGSTDNFRRLDSFFSADLKRQKASEDVVTFLAQEDAATQRNETALLRRFEAEDIIESYLRSTALAPSPIFHPSRPPRKDKPKRMSLDGDALVSPTRPTQTLAGTGSGTTITLPPRAAADAFAGNHVAQSYHSDESSRRSSTSFRLVHLGTTLSDRDKEQVTAGSPRDNDGANQIELVSPRHNVHEARATADFSLLIRQVGSDTEASEKNLHFWDLIFRKESDDEVLRAMAGAHSGCVSGHKKWRAAPLGGPTGTVAPPTIAASAAVNGFEPLTTQSMSSESKAVVEVGAPVVASPPASDHRRDQLKIAMLAAVVTLLTFLCAVAGQRHWALVGLGIAFTFSLPVIYFAHKAEGWNVNRMKRWIFLEVPILQISCAFLTQTVVGGNILYLHAVLSYWWVMMSEPIPLWMTLVGGLLFNSLPNILLIVFVNGQGIEPGPGTYLFWAEIVIAVLISTFARERNLRTLLVATKTMQAHHDRARRHEQIQTRVFMSMVPLEARDEVRTWVIDEEMNPEKPICREVKETIVMFIKTDGLMHRYTSPNTCPYWLHSVLTLYFCDLEHTIKTEGQNGFMKVKSVGDILIVMGPTPAATSSEELDAACVAAGLVSLKLLEAAETFCERNESCLRKLTDLMIEKATVAGAAANKEKIPGTVGPIAESRPHYPMPERCLPVGLTLRIGLHVGPLVAAVVGKTRIAYDIFGSTVNYASRLCSTSNLCSSISCSSEFRERCRLDQRRSILQADALQEEGGDGGGATRDRLHSPRSLCFSEPDLRFFKGFGEQEAYFVLPH